MNFVAFVVVVVAMIYLSMPAARAPPAPIPRVQRLLAEGSPAPVEGDIAASGR